MQKNILFSDLYPICLSPMGVLDFSNKKDEREEKLFNPNTLQITEHVVSPSKMLSLNSPLPFSNPLLCEYKSSMISKQLFFGNQ